MTDLKERASAILRDFKGENYAFGSGVLDDAPGKFASQLGKRALFIGPIQFSWFEAIKDRILKSLEKAGVEVVDMARSAAPNAPFVDVYRIHSHIMHKKPDVLVVGDGGSGIDATKAAATLATLGDIEPEIDPFFGVGQVTKVCESSGRTIMPVVAVMMAASSGAHLTKYSNITDPVAGQKKLIVDEAIIPPRAVFDYDVTVTQPMSLTLDGGLDGIAHCLEVYFGAPEEQKDRARQVAELGLELIIQGLTLIKKDPSDIEARTLLGLGTDLGGYAIMIGGTSGAHLTSFSLVDVLSHGRACALMNPYYTVFFAPAIEDQLRVIGEIYKKYGYIEEDLGSLSGRELGLAVARGMVAFCKFLEFPTCLKEVEGIKEDHITRCLTAAKDPQLDMKLRNMPVPLNADLVDEYMKPILEAAWDGNFEKIKTM
ncbi:MAG: iron-containing alcohol dehydrogenase [Deltaproteobacteria bacterium]|nr:iron-containing alcohol dehydrogenase [Deltaproteobacteria bacterium]MBW2137679.1 iron-containing alcohol dehydrogenase [Deltaproteobacteria bacterium]